MLLQGDHSETFDLRLVAFEFISTYRLDKLGKEFNPRGAVKANLRYADRWIEWLGLSDGQKKESE